MYCRNGWVGISLIMTNVDLVMGEFGQALRRHYGPRLERVVLFGSRARGDARPDSDYDVAVFLNDLGDLWSELDPVIMITERLLDTYDAEVRPMLLPAGAWRHPSLPLMLEIRRDGLDL